MPGKCPKSLCVEVGWWTEPNLVKRFRSRLLLWTGVLCLCLESLEEKKSRSALVPFFGRAGGVANLLALIFYLERLENGM